MSDNIVPLPRLHRTLPVYTPDAPPVPNWWQRLSTGQKVDLVLGTLITGFFITAYMMVPG